MSLERHGPPGLPIEQRTLILVKDTPQRMLIRNSEKVLEGKGFISPGACHKGRTPSLGREGPEGSGVEIEIRVGGVNQLMEGRGTSASGKGMVGFWGRT